MDVLYMNTFICLICFKSKSNLYPGASQGSIKNESCMAIYIMCIKAALITFCDKPN